GGAASGGGRGPGADTDADAGTVALTAVAPPPLSSPPDFEQPITTTQSAKTRTFMSATIPSTLPEWYGSSWKNALRSLVEIIASKRDGRRNGPDEIARLVTALGTG